MSREDTTIIGDKTKLPLKFVLGLCVMLVALCGAWYSLKFGQEETLREIREIKSAAWTKSQMAGWTRDLQIENAALKVPIVDVFGTRSTVKENP